MEILQTIWSVLTTENEWLINILPITLGFLEAYINMLLFTHLLNIPSTAKQKKLYVFLFTTIGTIFIWTIPSPYYTFANIILLPILILVIFKTNILKAILAEVFTYIISLLLNAIVISAFLYLFKIDSILVSTLPIYRILFCIIYDVLTYLVYRLLKHYNFKINISLPKHKKRFSVFMFNFIIGTISVAIQFYLLFVYVDYIPSYMILLSMFVLLVYFFISLCSLYRTSKLEITTEKLEEEKLYNQTLTLLYDNIRGFKHDFNNIVQGIGGYISTNNMEGLKEYYSEVLEDCQRVNNLALLSPEVINNPAIYSLLTSKYHFATELGIKTTLEIFMDLSTINMKIYDLTRILGILIDNAIEAAKQCEEKEIIITFRKDYKKNKQLFIIENTYTNKDVNIDEIFEKGKTSKKTEDSKNHGLGLWEVRQKVKKNKNLDLYTTKSEKYFKQQFEIYC